jgi:hypothetical protein
VADEPADEPAEGIAATEVSAEPEPRASLGSTMARYSVLRLGIFAALFLTAAMVLVPTVGSRAGWLDAGLVAVVVSLPVSYRLGRPMREAVTDSIDQRRAASRQRDADDAARIDAARKGRDPA